jgi:hypothetical protein
MRRWLGLTGALLFALAATTAQAQETTTYVLPAGQYRLQPSDEGRDLILIQGNKSVNSKASAFALTTPSGGHDPGGDKPTLVFSRHENQYVLSTIWDSRDEGHSVPKS